MLKILQAKVQQYLNQEVPDVQAGFWRGRGIRDKTANIYWIIEKAMEFQKIIYFSFIDYAKSFHCVNHTHTHTQTGKFFMRWEYQTILLVSWEACM